MRTVLVSRWAEAIYDRGKWPEMFKERRLPGLPVRRGRYIDYLDEIQDVDLAEGVRTPIKKAFERAAERVKREREEAHRKASRIIARKPHGWSLPGGVRFLTTGQDLLEEHEAMHHCVDTFIPLVEQGHSFILSIATDEGRSTAEIQQRTGEVLQHRGPYNSDPPRKNKVLLWMAMQTFPKQARS